MNTNLQKIVTIPRTPVRQTDEYRNITNKNPAKKRRLTKGKKQMNKSLLVAICTVFITSTAWAASTYGGVTDIPDGDAYVCRETSGGGIGSSADGTSWTQGAGLRSSDNIPNCATQVKIYYTQDPQSGGSGIFTGTRWRNTCMICDDNYGTVQYSQRSTALNDCRVIWNECEKLSGCLLEVCEGMSSWGTYSGTSSNHNETRCNSSTNKCEFRCADGYYNKGGTIIMGSPKRCAECPPNADCSNTTQPYVECHAGYYLVSKGNSISGYTKTCEQCPSLGQNNVKGRSAYGSTSITQCYIPLNTDILDATGTYLFTSDCHYSE